MTIFYLSIQLMDICVFFYSLAVLNCAAVNVHVQVFCGHVFLIFLGEIAGAQLLK